eukprot:TRINITY_DN3101_c0_g1_i1.p2 TRINITY_DN3101_c0_g1~~TRINITY_DN3101_c0_g1_i1.p2  ORF type:complete len:135 (+),score=19.48 TRINITY_DN3101_c0_g1_i1:56-460(+)
MADQIGVEEEDAAQLKLGPDFQEAQCLLNSEVAILLDMSQAAHAEDESPADMSQVFLKTLNYVKQFNRYKSKTVAKEVRSLLGRKSLAEFEIASLANLCPETTEEAKALIPTLSKLSDDELEGILNDLKTYSNF